MGYTTDFEGKFVITPPLSEAHKKYLTKFSETRRMKRNPSFLDKSKLLAECGLALGPEGEYYVEGGESSILSYNSPPSGQPGLWCKWVPDEEGCHLIWDGREKFYYYHEWLQYLLDNFLVPWGYRLDGTVSWQGEEYYDTGTIRITNNYIEV